MNPEVKKRLKWIKVYEKTKKTGMTCLRCGISRPTLRKWLGNQIPSCQTEITSPKWKGRASSEDSAL